MFSQISKEPKQSQSNLQTAMTLAFALLNYFSRVATVKIFKINRFRLQLEKSCLLCLVQTAI